MILLKSKKSRLGYFKMSGINQINTIRFLTDTCFFINASKIQIINH